MATRRKYKQKPQAFRDGGAVTELGQIPDSDDAASSLKTAARDDLDAERAADELEREAAQIAREREGTPVPASPAIAPAGNENPLLQALHAQRRAEELQRQRAATPQVDHAAIDSLPIHEGRKQLLRQYPELMRADLAPITTRAYHQVLASGIMDDSPQMNEAILQAVQAEIGQQARQQEAPTPPPAPSPLPAIEPERKRIPMSAPVSRTGSVATAGGREPGWNYLSAEEREVARNSFSDSRMTNAEKERLYWQNRERYKQMKRDGRYSVQQE